MDNLTIKQIIATYRGKREELLLRIQNRHSKDTLDRIWEDGAVEQRIRKCMDSYYVYIGK